MIRCIRIHEGNHKKEKKKEKRNSTEMRFIIRNYKINLIKTWIKFPKRL